MLFISCTFITLSLILLGTTTNGLCICVFLRERFRHRIVTPYFIALLVADSIYLTFRLIKLLYYSQTLFKSSIDAKQTCSNTSIYRAYQYATQTWPQTLIPLIHSETYIRFSLILMCIISVQRTTIISRSLKRLSPPKNVSNTYKHRWTIFLIFFAFLLAYISEFFGLTIFCSKSISSQMSFDWFVYMNKFMENSTFLLTNSMSNQTEMINCINDVSMNLQKFNETSQMFRDVHCNEENFLKILSNTFDQHQKSIVMLIQRIVYHQTNQNLSRNEIRRKYHFHECLFPQESNWFHRNYNFMYNRTFGINRYTFILVLSSILPSLITIVSNLLSMYNVRHVSRKTSDLINVSRRRTDDTRRVLLVITVECLFAIINSWFSDIVLSFIYCKKKFLAEDDCPRFLEENYHILVMFDLLNTLSNIVLHCISGQHFRHELFSMFHSIVQPMKNLLRHHCSCCWSKSNNDRTTNFEDCVYFRASISRTAHQESSESSEVFLTIHPTSADHRTHSIVSRQIFRVISSIMLPQNSLIIPKPIENAD